MTTAASWTSPAELAAQVERLWTRGLLLAATLDAAALPYPLRLRLARPDGRALAERFDEVRRWIRALDEGSRATRGIGYEITWEEINHRQLGRNQIPVAVSVPTQDDALALIGKRRQAERFAHIAKATLSLFPALRPWLGRHPFVALEHADDWERLLAVVAWLRDHPRSGLYLRQIELPGVHTKFIEAHRSVLTELLDVVLPEDAVDRTTLGARQFERRYGLRPKPPLVRFRLLDPRQCLGPLSDVATPASQFARLELPVRRVFITENEVNGLAFPSVPESLVVFGLGYGLERLSEVEWLRTRELHYWGDIDTHGFAMLDRLRAGFPAARSFLMDRETLMTHAGLWAREDARHDGLLSRLTADENALYEDLRRDRLGERVRLEQERISFGWLRQALQAL